MIDICIALDQSVSPHTDVRAIQNTGVFWQAVFQTPRPHSFFLDRGSAAKTLITQYRQLRRLEQLLRHFSVGLGSILHSYSKSRADAVRPM